MKRQPCLCQVILFDLNLFCEGSLARVHTQLGVVIYADYMAVLIN